jgi:hypothetical protein
MIRHIKRYLAIRSYMLRLSGDLARRFGRRPAYKVEQVTQAVQRGGFPAAFIAYAHAAYCSEEDFNRHYGPQSVACNYWGLRRTIARRYFSKQWDFDARTIFANLGQNHYGSDSAYGGGSGFYCGDHGGGSGHVAAALVMMAARAIKTVSEKNLTFRRCVNPITAASHPPPVLAQIGRWAPPRLPGRAGRRRV